MTTFDPRSQAWIGLSPDEIVRRVRCEADDAPDEGDSSAQIWRHACDTILLRMGKHPSQSPTPDGVIKERGEGRTWDEGITYGLRQLCAVLGVDPSKVSWDAATETVEGDVRSVIGNILRAWAADDWQDLPAIREMLLQGQGDDDGSQILPDFQEVMTIHAMVAACVHLLERRRDVINGYSVAAGVAPACPPDTPSSQESGVGETDPCGGCGATKDSERCMGCMHDFGDEASAWVRKHHPAPRPSQREG
ncbi:hypothetical protein [Methylobacterium sp. yr596]|uniref:hypothetical protein n=1 Tax=Methylobacterium sp. yr596 TaxID=1761800 RepID=UPI0008E22E4D|nr:hypothetical protein [Methylobacterium sp. yr596]SFF22218.1 hypothetical protein SAMN04487844_1123 [Methylobacterium sp. yr596]